MRKLLMRLLNWYFPTWSTPDLGKLTAIVFRLFHLYALFNIVGVVIYYLNKADNAIDGFWSVPISATIILVILLGILTLVGMVVNLDDYSDDLETIYDELRNPVLMNSEIRLEV